MSFTASRGALDKETCGLVGLDPALEEVVGLYPGTGIWCRMYAMSEMMLVPLGEFVDKDISVPFFIR